jgi:hypothetical protein
MYRKLLALGFVTLVMLAGLFGCSKPVTDASNDPPKGAQSAPMNSAAPSGGGGGSDQAKPQGAPATTQ